MARVLLAWELGAGLGHVGPLSSLARALTDAGHRVDVALPLLNGAMTRWFDGTDATLLPAPRWRPRAAKGTPASYADMLLQLGYGDVSALATHLGAWRTLVSLCRPDVIVFHAAPTAQLAARDLCVKRVAYGDGYFVPPLSTPLPALRHWVPADASRAIAAEGRARANLEVAFERARLPSWGDATLADLLTVDRTFLRTFPELDHYPARKGGDYLGPAFSLDRGSTLAWPDAPGPRIFCYLPARSPFFAPLTRCLPALQARVICSVPGIREADERRLSLPHVLCTPEPVRLDELRAECDLAVCHGGAGTVAAFLTVGVPLVLLPDNLERLLTTWRVRQLGACLAPRVAPEKADLGSLILGALADPELHSAASAFAERRRGYDPRHGERAVVDFVGQRASTAAIEV